MKRRSFIRKSAMASYSIGIASTTLLHGKTGATEKKSIVSGEDRVRIAVIQQNYIKAR